NHVDIKLTMWRCTGCNALNSTPTPVKRRAQNLPYTGQMGTRQMLSEVGEHTPEGALRCPRCGSTQFTAKRSNTGKVFGFSTLGVGGLIAPKSQVKCVACGLKFKRG